ncbi:VQ motif-containing protein 8 [Arachis hypogaea]|nr:VQ motif-containing protein 8 [Arachis hypogaea]
MSNSQSSGNMIMETSRVEVRRREVQLQGSKPAGLAVNNTKKKKKLPVIVHLRSPKVIHVKPQEFMALVQHLTGKSTTIASKQRQQHFLDFL